MSIYDTLNDNQKEAVFHTEGPLLILAGAGSGKTRVLTHRIAYLIDEKNVAPWNIMAITFTNKAASEMRSRVDDLVDEYSETIQVSTFHSTCVRILRRYIDRIGYDNNFTIYDTDDQKSVIKQICKKLGIDTKTVKEKTILNAISNAKNELITPEQYYTENRSDFLKGKIASAYIEYQHELEKNNALDFDDLIMKTVQLFKKDAEVLNYYQDKYRYIMVDEYQDTNNAQFTLISILADKYKNLCVVGDDDQSIYKFRGANIQNILNFEKKFKNTKVVKLEQNYRSTQNILNAANAVIRHNVGRKDKTLWTEHDEGSRIAAYRLENAYLEAEKIVELVKQYREENYNYNDCACLYRTNAQSRILEEKFIAANIPYKIVGGINFYQRKEIKDILAYLKTIDNARDDVAVKRIINIPKRGIGQTSIDRIQAYADDCAIGFYTALEEAEDITSIGKTSAKLKTFVEFISVLRSKASYIGVKELIEDVIEQTGYVKELEAEKTEEALNRIENIDELISKAADYEQTTNESSLSGFLEEVALIADIDGLSDEADYVVLMTIHNSKGLEFKNVFLCGMEDGLFPSYLSIGSGDSEELEEERRLCYVAITRAMENLVITAAGQRMIRGETQYNNASRFINEIPKDYMEMMIPERNTYVKPAFTRHISPKPIFTPKKFEVTKAKSLDYEVGDTVEHTKFGHGIVEAIDEGGRDYEVTVNFSAFGPKKMFAGFAKLKKV